jgi:Asp-tRNA(Asn)/Glu-tRNA(Gln) amidotransferase A subunit family amidase
MYNVSQGEPRSSARAAVERNLARIAAREEQVQAWAHIDAVGARAQAVAIDTATPSSPLAGLTLGVKDIIDVGELPCECGSPIFLGRKAFIDAAVVARLRALGMVVLGKTTTTEFAFLHPSKTRNPLNLDFSPGGSSSGSAAAVADGHVDAALGTQTAGSIVRPAAFCGVVGYKPSFGRLSRAGVLSTSPSLDTVGWLSKDVDTTIRIQNALDGVTMGAPAGLLGFCRTVHWPKAAEAMRLNIERLAQRLSATEVTSPPAFLDELHAAIMRYEIRQELAAPLLQNRDRLSPELGDYLNGTAVSHAEYLVAVDRCNGFEVESIFAGKDILLMPAALGGAVGFGSTGDPCFNRLATLLGLPSLTLPVGLDEKGLPLGLQLIARKNDDSILLATALHVEGLISEP